MKSPFPGMDPYLENYWGDVHHRLITYACDQIQPILPGDLRARVEERVFVESGSGDRRAVSPDVSIAESGRTRVARPGDGAGVATVEPLIVQLSDEPITQGYIRIIDTSTGNRVITVIEFISPTNKASGDGLNLYLKKQKEVREAGVNLVEIDLSRRGPRSAVLPLERIPPSHRTTYLACVRRGSRPLEIAVYPLPLTAALPTIAVPLRQNDGDAPLDLQALVDRCYATGRYDDLDYRVPPEPALPPEEATWADELLRSAGRRP
jgi:hypothetical protein